MPNSGRLTQFARQMRKESTNAEREIWQRLRGHRLGGLKFRRQQPLGVYIADFYCAMARVVVELDGVTHEDRADYDRRRDAYLRDQGIRVVRFTEEQFYADIDGCLREIYAVCRGAFPDRGDDYDALSGPPPSPSDGTEGVT